MEPNKHKRRYYQKNGLQLTDYAKKKARRIIAAEKVCNSNVNFLNASEHEKEDEQSTQLQISTDNITTEPFLFTEGSCTETLAYDVHNFDEQNFGNLMLAQKEGFSLIPDDNCIEEANVDEYYIEENDVAGPCMIEEMLNIFKSGGLYECNSDMEDNFQLSFHGLLESELQENDQRNCDDLPTDASDNELFEEITGRIEAPTSIDDLKKDEKFLIPIGACINRSPGEILLMILKFSLENKLAFSATTDLLTLINKMFDKNILPETRYRIDRLCNPKTSIHLHSICSICSEYLGTFEHSTKSIKCSTCGATANVANPSDPSFFAIIDPTDAIKDHLECHQDFYKYVMKERIHEKNNIIDIFDGKAYRNFKKNLSASERDYFLSMILNTDGAPVFKSSNYSVWPLYIMPNEIPVQERQKNVIVLALWFGKGKPNMDIFLQKVVEFLNNLSLYGVNCKIKGEDCCVKVFTIHASVDTVARTTMNGTVQFNGHFGCDWCEHPGEYFAGSMRYPFLVPSPPDRNEASQISYAEQALNDGRPILGVKSASPLLTLKYFDIVSGFSPDYMHCMLAGVAAQFTEYIINEMSKEEVEIMDKWLAEFRVPDQICRLSRPLKDRAHWKAREWENWIIYYSLPLLMNFCKDKHRVQHWSLLVKSLHICLQDHISYTELNDLNELLHAFVSHCEELYSLKSMTYNVHQLLHIPTSIQLWGPVFAHSTFPFESANHKLLCAIQSAKGVILQIVRYLNMQRFVALLEKIVHPQCSDVILQFCKDIHSSKVKKVLKIDSITYFGKPRIIDTTSLNKYNLSRTTKVFLKIVKQGCLYASSLKINKRSCNYFCQLKNGKLIKIIKFLVDAENNRNLTICQEIETKTTPYVNIVKEIFKESDEIMAVPTTDILKPVVCIDVCEKRYIVPVPNLLFY